MTDKIVEYLENDTLLYLAATPKELCNLEREKWLPIVDWANETYKLDLKPSYNVTEVATVPNESRLKLHRHISSMNFAALNGFLYGVDSIKSVLLILACLGARLSTEEAGELANLEQHYQAKIYQKVRALLITLLSLLSLQVEGHHDVQEYELLNRLSAAVFYIQVQRGSQES